MLFNLMSKESDITLKAITLGEYGVGKTSFCNLLNKKKFVKNTKQTLGINFETVEYKNNDNIYKLYIWDTSGHPRFERILNLYVKNTKIFFLVFNHSKIETFNLLKKKLELIKEYVEGPNVMLIGNIFDDKRVDNNLIKDFVENNNLDYLEIDCKKEIDNEIFKRIFSLNKIPDVKDLTKEKDRSFCSFLF